MGILVKGVKSTILLLGLLIGGSAFAVSLEDSIRVNNYLQKAENQFNVDIDQTLLYLDSAQVVATGAGWELGLAEIQLQKCRAVLTSGDVEQAMLFVNKAIDLFKKNESLASLAHCYSLKSIIHGRLNENDQGIDLLIKAIEINEQLGNAQGLASTYVNLSLAYRDTRQFEKAEEVLLKAIDLNIQENLQRNNFYTSLGLGSVYNSMKEYEKAKKYLFEAWELGVEYNNTDGVVTVLNSLGNMYAGLGDNPKAIYYYDSCRAMATHHNLPMELSEVLNDLTVFYKSQGKYDLALAAYQDYTTLKDSLYNIEKVNKIAQLEKRLDLRDKELMIKEQNTELVETRTRLEYENLVIIIVLIALLALGIALVFIVKNLQAKRKAYEVLQKQREEILEINEELNQQNEEISAQRDFIETQRKELEVKNNDVRDSITYARRIQEAMLPELSILDKVAVDHFVLYQPKDLVSGDFYWVHRSDQSIYIALADCTGHGVPGAFVSLVGYNHLKALIKEFPDIDPVSFMERLSEAMSASLNNRYGGDNSANSEIDIVQDGMDLALCKIELDTLKMEFCGANNSMYVVSKNKLEGPKIEYKGDDLHELKPIKRTVGYTAINKPFESTTIQLTQGDVLYLFSDGYPDQFGGPRGKKMTYRRFRSYLLEGVGLTMQKQQELLEKRFNSWQGHEEQVDDLCVIGMKM